MKYAFMASVMALGLAACGGGGGGGKAALIKACTADGQGTKEECTCMADAAEEKLDKPLFTKLVKAATNGEDGVQAMIGDLSAEEQGKFMGFAMSAAMQCGISG